MSYDERPIKSHRDLIVWQRAMQVRREVRVILLSLPLQDRFEIGGQVARAALSIPANIAEGHGRMGRADYEQFLSFSRGSIGELDTQMIGIAEDHPNVEQQVRSTLGSRDEVSRMVTSILRELRVKARGSTLDPRPSTLDPQPSPLSRTFQSSHTVGPSRLARRRR